MPSFAIKLGLVVTPSKIPRSFASLIWAKLAVSMKNFMESKLGFLFVGFGYFDTHFLHRRTIDFLFLVFLFLIIIDCDSNNCMISGFI